MKSSSVSYQKTKFLDIVNKRNMYEHGEIPKEDVQIREKIYQLSLIKKYIEQRKAFNRLDKTESRIEDLIT